MTGQYTVYEFYDASGECLYVGATMKPAARMWDHRHSKTWWGSVKRTVMTTYDSEDEAAEEEARLIAALAPRHNRAGVTSPAIRYNAKRRPVA